MSIDAGDVLFAVGLLTATVGAGLISVPLALLVLGVAAMLLALIGVA